MREFLAAAAMAALILPAPAGAQEKAPIWSGIYVGAHGGWLTADHDGDGIYHGSADWSGPPTTVFSGGNIDVDGGFAGAQAGLNWQIDRLVLGIEGDISWANADGDALIAGTGANSEYDWDIKTELEWFATLRGRLGALLTPNLLVYGTGGVAWAKASFDEVAYYDLASGPTVIASASDTKVGWVIGAGAEWRFAQNWSLKGEWQRIDLGDVDAKFSGVANATGLDGGINQPNYTHDSFDGSVKIDTFRLGVNYKFD